MEVVYPCCCGLDVHKKSITACVLWAEATGKSRREEALRDIHSGLAHGRYLVMNVFTGLINRSLALRASTESTL
jgi:hypothetical protein